MLSIEQGLPWRRITEFRVLLGIPRFEIVR